MYLLQTCNFLSETERGVITISGICINRLIGAVNNTVKFVKTNARKVISASFCIISSVALLGAVIAGGVRLAYNIKYNDKIISTVSDKKVYFAAVDLVADMVESENVKEVLPEPEIVTVVTLDSRIESPAEVADDIIDNTAEIIPAAKLTVDGVTVACSDKESLLSALEERKSRFNNVEGAYCESDFCSAVRVEDAYYVLSEVSDISEIASVIDSLDIKTTANISYEQPVAYKTTEREDADKQIGYRVVEQKGENGVNLVSSGVVYINGIKTEETTDSVKVIKEPVDEIVVVGTKKPTVSSVSLASGFRFPLPAGTWELSCPYGRRGHKGVDLRAPVGTPITASASGKVVLASYNGSYGNCVIIDHGNGVSTLYAHASRLCTKEGDYVSAGEVIALVGSTGNSTGYHMHFEIHVGDKRINPQPYIGL